MIDPFEDLEADHRVIDKVLSALEAATPENTDLGFFRSVVDFIQQFADGVHHQKEEEHLFPALVLAGVQKDMGPVGVMLEEHEHGRDQVARMTALLETGDLAGLCEAGRAYAAHMRSHITKEEQALFMIGRIMLRPPGAEKVAEGFASIDSIGAMRERHDSVADALCEQVHVTPTPTV